MSVLKHVISHDGGHYGYRFLCPGCKEMHVIPTKPHERGWDFNGNEASPTFGPSILVHEVTKIDGTIFSPRCHSFVRDGRIQFLSDSGHALKGQTVDLPDVESGDGG
jgi:hypothetical protein